jgi:AraC-like DNA-binding protein
MLDAGGSWRDDDNAIGGFVIGPMSRVAPGARRQLPAMIGAYLYPGELRAFVGMPASELTNETRPIDDVWRTDGSELSEHVASAVPSDGLAILERALMRRMTAPVRSRSSIDVRGLAESIGRRAGRVSVGAMAEAAGVSRQRFARVFRERVGVSPKLFSRLARFSAALGYVRADRSQDWAGVAFELGYTDQSHMIAEFREFSSLTPRMLECQRWFHPFIARAAESVRLRRAQAKW